MIKYEFRHLSQRAQSTLSFALCQIAVLISRIQSLTTLLKLIGGLMFLGVCVEGAIGFLFNDALLTNTANELSISDQLIRAAAAIGSVLSFMGVVAALHGAFNSGTPVAWRILAVTLAIGIGVGLFVAAASVGNQAYGSILSKLWSGSAQVLQFDATVVGPGENVSTPPLILKMLTGAALFIGVGFFVAVLELAWFKLFDARAKSKEELAKLEVIRSEYEKMQQAKIQIQSLEEDLDFFEDKVNCRNYVESLLQNSLSTFQEKIGNPPPNMTRLHKLTPEAFAQNEQENKLRTESIEISKSVLLSNKINDLLDKHF